MIGVHPSFKERVYEEKFWPRNIYFIRFNFRRGHQLLDNSRDVAGQTETESSRVVNFQELASSPITTKL